MQHIALPPQTVLDLNNTKLSKLSFMSITAHEILPVLFLALEAGGSLHSTHIKGLIKEVGSMGEAGCYGLYVVHPPAHMQTRKLGLN